MGCFVNKVELLKSEKGGLEILKDIHRFANEGWESISEADIQRLKWYGLFLRTPTPGHFMLRVRIPNGHSFSHQIRTLAQIATGFGNGVIDITSRQQVQIRHLRIEQVPDVFQLLRSVGLTSMQTGMDNVRNIMGCPVAGLHPAELMDASSLVQALNEHIVGNPEFTNLPRKFNVMITGCPDNCLHAETQDLALIPAVKEKPDGGVDGFNILVGGKLGSGGYRIASPLDAFVLPEEVIDVCSEIILLYRDHGCRESRSQNRLAFLIDEWGEERFRKMLEQRLGRPLARSGTDARVEQKNEHLGIYRQKQPLMNYVGLKVPVGRIHAEKLERLADLAQQYGNGEIRISSAQVLIVPNVSDKLLGDFLEEPLLKELLYCPSGIMKGLTSCVGIDYCHMATIETKSRALEVARKLETMLKDVAPISMNWSGCPAGCGNHLVADIGLLGKRANVNGEIVDAVDVYVGGRTGPNPKPAIKFLENIPCDLLPEALKHVIPYHARGKMYRIKGMGKAGKRNKNNPSSLKVPVRTDSPEMVQAALPECP